MKNKILYILFFFVGSIIYSQTDSLKVEKNTQIAVKDSIVKNDAYDPLEPSRAAFYSAVLPGLGQAYNKKYWKIPIVYAGIGTGIYFYIQNTQEYNRFRNIYKRRLAGFEDDEFQGISTDRIIDAQRNASRNRDVSLVVAIGFYLLNIVDANVDAHLRQYNISDDLSLSPQININPLNAKPQYGFSLNFNLK